MKTIINFIINHWEFIGPVIYEIAARLWPTKLNISILDNAWKIVNALMPNNRIPDGNEKMLGTNAAGKVTNHVKVKIGKHILRTFFILALFGVTQSHAQIWQNYKGVRFVNESDTTSLYAVEGSMYYDDELRAFYGRDRWGWKPFQLGGGGEFWPLAGSALVTDDVVLFGGSKTVTLGSITPFSEFTIQSNTVNTFSTIDGGDRTDLIMSAVQFSLTHNGLDGIIQNATGVKLQGTSVDANVTATGGNDVNITSTNGNVFVEANSALNLSSANTTILNGSSLSGFYTDVTGTAVVSDAANITLTEGTGVIELTGNIDLQPTSSASELYSGTYTPVGTTSTNTTVVTPTIAQYMRVGNVVTVSGRVDVTFAGAGVARWELSVPIATNFSNQWEGNGTFMKQDAVFGGGIISLAATETVQFSTQASGAGAFSGFCYTYTYQILP